MPILIRLYSDLVISGSRAGVGVEVTVGTSVEANFLMNSNNSLGPLVDDIKAEIIPTIDDIKAVIITPTHNEKRLCSRNG